MTDDLPSISKQISSGKALLAVTNALAIRVTYFEVSSDTLSADAVDIILV